MHHFFELLCVSLFVLVTLAENLPTVSGNLLNVANSGLIWPLFVDIDQFDAKKHRNFVNNSDAGHAHTTHRWLRLPSAPRYLQNKFPTQLILSCNP